MKELREVKLDRRFSEFRVKYLVDICKEEIIKTNMSGSCIIPLLRDYDVKEVKLHTFKLKHDDITEKETLDVEKSDGTAIEILPPGHHSHVSEE